MWSEVLGEAFLIMSPFILIAFIAGLDYLLVFTLKIAKKAKRNRRRIRSAISSAVEAFIDNFNQAA